MNLPIPPSGKVNPRAEEVWRLLGYPGGEVPKSPVAGLIRGARDWFEKNSSPWIHWRYSRVEDISGDRLRFEDVELRSGALARRLKESSSQGAVLFGASAGPETEAEITELWQSARPDEAYVLDAYASAVVEELVRTAGGHLCQIAEPQGFRVLPHYSPGYAGWQLEDQPILLKLLEAGGSRKLSITPSGMLLPRKSLLGIFGLSRYPERVSGDPRFCPCLECVLEGCRFRRVPASDWNPSARPYDMEQPQKTSPYGFPEKALRKWATRHLRLEFRPGGTQVAASFDYEGTTCSNMGRPLRFLFEVELEHQEGRYVLRACRCRRPKESGWENMCSAVSDTSFVGEVEGEHPFEGHSLEEALAWRPTTNPAGCLCSRNNRNHKWQIVFHTIHFALHAEDRS